MHDLINIVFEIATGIIIGLGIGLIIGITLRVLFDTVLHIAGWGVVSDFVGFEGTGAGRSAQDTPEIGFRK